MKILKHISFFTLFLFIFSCKDDELKDTEKPKVIINFPENCNTVKRGKPFTFKANFSDNVALGSYSIDIHNNFDHHTHSTEEIEQCTLAPKKKPINTFKTIKTYTIEGNKSFFKAEQTYTIGTEFDSGNYHFHVKVTDAEGWTTYKGISIYVE